MDITTFVLGMERAGVNLHAAGDRFEDEVLLRSRGVYVKVKATADGVVAIVGDIADVTDDGRVVMLGRFATDPQSAAQIVLDEIR